MDKSISTYALIKSLYDQGEDYIDSFWPFAIKIFPADEFIRSTYIQENLKKKIGLDIPIHVLRIILDRAETKGYVISEWRKRNQKKYKLTNKGAKYRDTLETDKEVERRINALIADIKQFFNMHGVSLSSNQINDLLFSFLQKNAEPLTEFINPSAMPMQIDVPHSELNENLLIEYIKDADLRKPESYNVLRDMVLGSIISTVLYVKDLPQITEIKTRGLKNCYFFLDTNFVFFLLGLHLSEFNDPAKELFFLLRNYGCTPKVFSFTIDEICNVIGGYGKGIGRYPETVTVDTLYSSLKRAGWTKTNAEEFITNIENTLNKKGIEIEWVKNIDLKTYTPKNEKLRNLIGKYKPFQDTFHRNHDLAAIEKIKELRGNPVRKIEDSKAIFLTSDSRLSKFNFIEMGHKDNGTVCEIILDRLLTNILWLKDPSLDISLKSIIVAHSRNLFIKKNVWDQFYTTLMQLRKEGKIQDENISMLFFHRYIEDVLKEFDEEEVCEITPEFVLKEIEKSTKFGEGLIEEAEKRVQKIKENLRKSADESAKNRILLLRILIASLLIILLCLCLFKHMWALIGNIATLLFCISLIVGLLFDFSVKKWWKKIEKKYSEKIYNKDVKKIDI